MDLDAAIVKYTDASPILTSEFGIKVIIIIATKLVSDINVIAIRQYGPRIEVRRAFVFLEGLNKMLSPITKGELRKG